MSRPYRSRVSQLVVAVLLLLLRNGSGLGGEPEAKPLPTSREFFEQAQKDSAGREWRPLFNGESLEGWKVVLSNAAAGEDPDRIFQVAEGEIHVYRDTPAGKEMPFGVILSDQAYSEYRFRFEYKWGEKKFAPRTKAIRDAGLLFHVVGPEKVWPMSVECQVQEGDVGDNFLVYTGGDAPVGKEYNQFEDMADGGKLASFYTPGSVTRVVKSKALEKEGWNVVEVIVRKDAAIYLVNGEINNYVVNMRAPIGPEGAIVPLTSGRLALQCEWAELFYRNIELLSLEALPPAVSKEGSTPHPQLLSPEYRGEESLKKTTFVPADESIAPVAPRSPEEGLKSWTVRDGFRVELVAAEPLVLDPVAIDWGLDGKLWVVEMADYPLGMDGKGKAGGRVRFLEKSQQDGPYDRSTLFLEGVNFPTGIVSWGKGVIVTAAPEIFYAEDTNGDGTCDVKKVLFSGFNAGNQQLRINGLRRGLDGWLHCASGGHNPVYGSQSQVHAHLTGKDIVLGSRDFRFHPGTGELEPLSGPSQFGRNNDDFDNWFGVQNSYPLWHYVLEDKYLQRNPHFSAPDSRQVLSEGNPRVFPAVEIGAQPNPQTHVGRFTSACSGMVYRDQLLPLEQSVAHAFTCEPVHHLVQHNLLSRSGPSFQMQRDVEGEATDFLASTDPWCRPVMVRTGPDGALWVVDMYRFIIEHPEWVPQSVQKEMEPYLRLGDGRGRLYRVLPASDTSRTVPDILAANPQELVALLDHPNGWVRNAAQQRLIELHDPASIQNLRDFLQTPCTSIGKLHAAYSLRGLNACDAATVSLLLDDAAEEIRRHGLRLAEELESPGDELLAKIANMVSDPSDVVQLQLACSLGTWNDPQAILAMASMWNRSPRNSYIQAALFSSLNQQNIAAVLEVVAKSPVPDESARQRYRQLMEQALAFEQIEPLQQALQQRESQAADDLVRAIIVLDILPRKGVESAVLKSLDAGAVASVYQQATTLLEQDEMPTELRVLAISLLFQREDPAAADGELVERLLSGTLPAHVQEALIRHLGEQPGKKFGELLLTGWSGFVPSTRQTILEIFASHPDWYPLLVEQIDAGKINSQEITLSLQQRFLSNQQSPAVKELEKRFQLRSNVAGMASTALREVLDMPGDALRGQQVFQKNCADCHQFRGEGHLVGPNLSSVTGRTPAAMLEAILDPNKAIEPKYLNYTLGLNDGRVLSGLIENDSGNSLTLLKAKGEKTFVPRHEVEELRSTGKSLMPEGFDRTLPLQDLADLILYLQQAEGSALQSSLK